MNRKQIQQFVLRHRTVWLGIAFGAVVGYVWYDQVGCANGSCLISSSPLRSIAYFSFVGALFAQSFVKKNVEPENVRIEETQQ